MPGAELAVVLALSILGTLLFCVGAAEFIALVKGCFVLRRLARSNTRDVTAVLLKSALVPEVSAIATPPDDSAESFDLVRRLVGLHFGKHEVVVVLNSPSEAAMARWSEAFRLERSARAVEEKLSTSPVRAVYASRDPVRLVVVDKERGGEADAWNAGVNVATSPVIALVDPKCQFVPELLLRLIRPMLEDFEQTIAVCGVGLAPRPSGVAGSIGTLSSLRTHLGRCAAFAGWNILAPVPGACLLVKREPIIATGGFTAGPLELALRLHAMARGKARRYRIAFVPEPVSYTPAPDTLPEVRSLMLRDQRQIARALRRQISLRGGITSLRWGLPALFCIRFLRPLLETVAYLLVVAGLIAGWVSHELAIFVLLSTVGIGMVISLGAVVLRELAEYQGSDPGRLFGLLFSVIPENLGFRQLRNLWLLAGFLRASL